MKTLEESIKIHKRKWGLKMKKTLFTPTKVRKRHWWNRLLGRKEWIEKNYDYENPNAEAVGMVMPYPDCRKVVFDTTNFGVIEIKTRQNPIFTDPLDATDDKILKRNHADGDIRMLNKRA